MQAAMHMIQQIYMDRVTPELVAATARKLVVALAKTKPTRWRSNPFIVQMMMVEQFTGASDEGVAFFRRLRDVVATIRTLRPLRVKYAFDLLYNPENVAATASEMLNILTGCEQEFVDTGDGEYHSQMIEAYGFSRAGCGHYTLRASPINVMEYVDSRPRITTICQHCLDNGSYVTDMDGYNIHLDHAVDAYWYNLDETCYVHRSNPDIVWDEDLDNFRRRSLNPNRSLISGYHSSRSRGFRKIESPWSKSHNRMFGYELEVQTRNMDRYDAAAKIHKVLNGNRLGNYVYFENDGSIGDTGFEIISQPAGLDVHKEKLALFLNDPELKRGLRSHEGGACGFHVHIGREFLTKTQIWRMQAFLNDPRNETLIRKVARRYNTNYCHIKYHMAKLSAKDKDSGDRYDMLNVTNGGTVEFRIFRGSLRYESIMAALEFCNALCEFCAPGVTQFDHFNSIGFKRFILRKENAADTKFLRAYLGIGPVIETRNDSEQEVQQARAA
jgi:hypothetical protein